MAEIIVFDNLSDAVGDGMLQELPPEEEAGTGSRECMELSCFANKHGICDALCSTDFGMRRCPFFKTEEELAEGQLDALQRLVDRGRFDLIEKYRGTMEELGILDCEDSFFHEHQEAVDYLAQLREMEKKLKEESLQGTFADDAADEWDDGGWDEDDEDNGSTGDSGEQAEGSRPGGGDGSNGIV